MNGVSRHDALLVASGAVNLFYLTSTGDERFRDVLRILDEMIREEEMKEEHQ